MFNFAELVMNENMKIYRRSRTWVMIGIMLALNAFISVIAYFQFDGSGSMWSVFHVESVISFLLVTVFTAIIAAGSVADEFTTGTIKLLLIRPWTRSKILLSKYISILLFALFAVILLYLFIFVVNLLLFGYDNPPASQLMVPLYSGSVVSYFLQYYILKFVSLVVTATLAFMLSAIFRSGGLAIGLSLFIILGVNTFMSFLAIFDYAWINYLLFIHLDLIQYLNQTPLRAGLSFSFSLGMLAAYYVVFIFLTWYVFSKRDVAA
ncbi:MAG: ABC transporter permease [Candidatus Pristimantibacillus sp.]